MADKKVSELTEETDLSKVHAIGVKNVNEAVSPCRYNLGKVEEKISTIVNGILPESETTDFTTSRDYYCGQFCRKDGVLYRFIQPHWKGSSWTGSDVIQTSFSSELNAIMSNDFETLSAVVDFFNADGSRASDADTLRNGKNVEVYFDDGSNCIQTTDSSGITVFTIKKGTHFILSSQEVSGYASPPNCDYIASISTSSDGATTYGGRIVNLNYRNGVSENSTSTCSVTAHIRINGSESTMVSAYDGTVISLIYPHGEYEKRSTLSPINETVTYNAETSSAIAVFNNVKQGEYCNIFIENLINYEQVGSEPTTSAYCYDNKGFFASGSNYNTYIDVSYSNNYGIFYVCGDNFAESETERTPLSARWTEYRLEEYPGYTDDWESTGSHCLTAKYPCVAIHIKPAELSIYNADYYVIPSDLTTQREISNNLSWCTANVVLPHVPYNYYDIAKPTDRPRTAIGANGKLATAYMMYDSNRVYGAYSNAAKWVISQTLTLNTGTDNVRTAHGFIGTRDQWQFLLDASNILDSALKWFGYDGQYYKTGTHWWTSSQSSATTAWFWVSSGSWNNGTKTTSYRVLRFFAF